MNRILKALMTCAGLVMAGSHSAAAPQELSGDLGGILSLLKLESAAVSGLVTVTSDKDQQWMNGLTGSLRPSQFSLKHLGGTRQVTGRMQLSCGDSTVRSLKIARCDAEESCTRVETKGTADSLRFTFDDNSWEMTFYENPCAAMKEETSVAPWALEHRRRNQGGSVRSFPEVAALILHGSYISVIDLQSRRYWDRFRVKPGSGAAQGELKHAFISEQGKLKLYFSHSTFMLDVGQGRLFQLEEGKVTTRATLTDGAALSVKKLPFEDPFKEDNEIWPEQKCDCRVTFSKGGGRRTVTLLDAKSYRVLYLP